MREWGAARIPICRRCDRLLDEVDEEVVGKVDVLTAPPASSQMESFLLFPDYEVPRHTGHCGRPVQVVPPGQAWRWCKLCVREERTLYGR